jgi:hypothetical protein
MDWTDAGLCCYDGSTYKVFNETDGLKYDKIWSIVEEYKKHLLSLYGHGLAKYDGKKVYLLWWKKMVW